MTFRRIRKEADAPFPHSHVPGRQFQYLNFYSHPARSHHPVRPGRWNSGEGKAGSGPSMCWGRPYSWDRRIILTAGP